MGSGEPLGHRPHPRLLRTQTLAYGVQREFLRTATGGVREVFQGVAEVRGKGKGEGLHVGERRRRTGREAKGFTGNGMYGHR